LIVFLYFTFNPILLSRIPKSNVIIFIISANNSKKPRDSSYFYSIDSILTHGQYSTLKLISADSSYLINGRRSCREDTQISKGR
jgi:hypothetical protein